MTDVWHDSTAIGQSPAGAPPPPLFGDHHRRVWITLGVVTVLVVTVLVAAGSFAVVRSWDGFKQSLANIGSGLANLEKVMESGGTASNAAAFSAAPLPPGFLSVPILNAKLPSYQWVDGATNVPYSSSKRPIVGVSATGTHVVTAVQATQGFCSFGLTITSNADPLIAQDGLSGEGTYYQFVHETSCVADQAPTSSWQLWSPG